MGEAWWATIRRGPGLTGGYLRNKDLLYFLSHQLPGWPQHCCHKVSPSISAGTRRWARMAKQKVRLARVVLLLSISRLRHYGLQAIMVSSIFPTAGLCLQARYMLLFFPDSLLLSEIASSLWELLSSAPALLYITCSLIFLVWIVHVQNTTCGQLPNCRVHLTFIC